MTSLVDQVFERMAKDEEKRRAITIAEKLLNRDWGDPDDDYGVLSRQLLRALERLGEYTPKFGDEL